MEPRANPLLFGHEAAEARFEEALRSGRLHHAWLLTGPPGIGKATLAFRMIRRLMGATDDPEQPTFRRIRAGTHADLLTLEREVDPKTKRMRREILVDQLRAVPGFMQKTPAEGGWRAVLIDGAEEMNRNAANALLKVLEEPPRRAVLLLVSAAPGRLLPTIRSRCRRLPLDALDAGAMGKALSVLMPDAADGERGALSALAGGSPGRALALAGEGGLEMAALVRGLLDAPAMPVERMYDVADRVARDDADFDAFMTLLQEGVAGAVRTAARGGARSLRERPLAEWGEVWHALGQLHQETGQFSLDKRAAVVAGLQLLPKADRVP